MNEVVSEMMPIRHHWLIKSSNIPVRYQGWNKKKIVESSGKFPPAVDEWIDDLLAGEIIKNPGGLGTTGVGLLFAGPPGEGKTTHAVVAAMEAILRLPDDKAAAAKLMHASEGEFGHNFKAIHFLTFPEFVHMKRATYDAEGEDRRKLQRTLDGFHGRAKEDWMNVRILIIDDLGKEYGSALNNYIDSTFDELLRSRYDKGLPTIITTNVAREDWAAKYSEAMGSFAYEAFRSVRIANKDLRKNG